MLLERHDQMLALEAMLADAAGSRGGMALVGGEAGAGKSSVVAAFAASVVADSQRAVRILRGTCDDLTTPAALGPIIEALPQVEQFADEEGVDRHRLFRRIRAIFAQSPSLFVVEDVHWADEATLDLLRFLGRRLEGLPLLLVPTYRTEETSGDHPLTRVLGDLSSAPGVRRIVVPPLSGAAVRTLAERSESSLDQERLFARTGGNAFYVTEALASPADEVPPTVRDAVLARGSRLSADAREVLAGSAVLGQPADLALLVAVTGRAPAAVDECVASGLLTGDGTRWDFRHALARDAVAGRLPPARASSLHAAALHHLRQTGDDRRLAFHAAQCGDRSSVAYYAPLAAARAARLGAHREAADFYRMAIDAHPGPDETRAMLWSALSYECYLTGRPDLALDARHEALALAAEPAARGEAERWISRLSWFIGQNDDSEVYAARAVATLEPLGPSPGLAMAYSNCAQLRMLANEPDAATLWGTRALEMARSLGDRDTEIHALNNLGSAATCGNDYHGGMAQLSQSLDLSLAADAHEHAARAFTNLGSSAAARRRYPEADRHLRAGIAYCRDRDLDSWTHYMSAWYARSLADQGHYAAALDTLSGPLPRPHLPAIVRVPALVVAGQIAARRGNQEGVPLVLDEAASLARDMHEAQRLVPVAVARAEAAWLDGQSTVVDALFEEAWRVSIARPDPWELGELSWWLDVAGDRRPSPITLAEPFRLMLDADWSDAAACWEEIGCPLWVALCLARRSEIEAARQALRILDRLDAPAVKRAVIRDRRERGLPVPRGPRATSSDNQAGLTTRELQVLTLLVDGLSNAEIAHTLVLSPKTVGHHVSSILTRLGEPSRSRAAAAAIRHGIVPATRRGA